MSKNKIFKPMVTKKKVVKLSKNLTVKYDAAFKYSFLFYIFILCVNI